MLEWQSIVFAIAACLDYLIGDPWGWPHPVRIMGCGINAYRKVTLNVLQHPQWQRWAGIGLAIGLTIGSGFVGWLAIWIAHQFHFGLALALESILLASCFAGRSLRAAAEEVLCPLRAGNLQQARAVLQNYVGRDTDNLSTSEVLRAVLETVTENATDGVMAPLFYGLLGAAIPGVGSVPLALAYKASSTLDSMVGYREAPYTYLGWCSARLEDVLTWLPCRLTVLTLALLSGKPLYVWRVCCRDAIADPSPNAGWSECAYAAVLGVQMGGTNCYRGIMKQKPLLGNPIYPITPLQIRQALQLTRYSFLIWLGIAFTISNISTLSRILMDS